MSISISLEELAEAGAHFGHQVKRWNPKISPYIYSKQEGIHVFDLFKTKEALDEVLNELSKTRKEGKTILLVGTKKQARDAVRKVGEELKIPYVVERWIGGTFTNFEQVRKSVKTLLDLKKKMAEGGFSDYTKKERLLIERKIADLEKSFGGVTNLESLPDLMIIVDTHKESGAVKEAKKVGVSTIGIVDSNADPSEVTWPVPMNDDSVKAIEYVLELMKQAMTVKSKK